MQLQHVGSSSLRGALFLLVTTSALACAPAAFAQSVPNAGTLLNEQRTTPRPPRPPAEEPAPTLAIEGKPKGTAIGSVSMTIRTIALTGDRDLIAAERLEAMVQPAIGRTLDHAGLQAIADDITRTLRQRGYALAYAYLPRQDVTDGALTITVVAGRLEQQGGGVTVTGRTRIPARRLAAIVDTAREGDAPLRSAPLERAVLLVNDLPGITASATLRPGATAGTSHIDVQANEASLIGIDLSVDNYGSPSTGSTRVGGGVRLVDPLHIGDQLIGAVRVTSGSTLGNVVYALPLTPSGLSLTLSGSYLDYRVNQAQFRALDLTGSAASLSAQLAYPIVRSRRSNLYAALAFEHLVLKDDVRGVSISDRRVDDVTLNLSATLIDAIGAGGITDAGVTMTVGTVDLSRNRDQWLVDRLTARIDGTYARANGHLAREQMLDRDQHWSLFASMTGQIASDNLDSSQKFLSGGPSGVRGYAVGDGIGDQGLLGTLEVRRSLAVRPLRANVQLLGFVDGARVWADRHPWSNPGFAASDDSRGLYAAGIGLNASGSQWSLRTALARRIGGDSSQNALLVGTVDRSDWRAWCQAAFRF